MAESVQENRYKRKRKKNFLKNARKYGKKGCYGRGSELDEETYQYFIRILEVYKEGFPNEEEKGIFVNNVFQQTEENEVNYSCNQVGCRVIQMLLPFANDQYFERYMDAFLIDLRPLCNDRFASHVLQTLLEVSYTKSVQPDMDKAFKEKCQSTAVKISKFLLNNLEDYIWDTYGNHIIRTVFTTLSNLKQDEKNQPRENPEVYTEIIKQYAERLIAWPQFSQLPYKEVTSGFLQILLKALEKIDPKQLKIYLKKLLSECFALNNNESDHNVIPEVFNSKPAIMLLETSLEVAPPKLFTKIYAQCFINKLLLLSTTRATNFSVQKLISNCKEKTEFEAIFEELSENFGKILDCGHSGVILSLAQTCKRLSAKQGSFVQNIMKAHNCYDPEERQNSIVLALCKFSKFEDLSKNKEVDLQKINLNLHGTLIVELILTFNKPIKIINSLLNMDKNDLKNLFSNRMGSHIADSYMNSEFVGEKSRDKLVKKMSGCYQELASSKYGSRSFEAFWNVASSKNRASIMNELANKDGAWSNSEHGKIIASKINLSLYKRSKDEWSTHVNKAEKTKALFKDIVDS